MRLMKYLAVMIAGFFVVSAEAAQNQKIQGVTLVFASDVEGQYKGEKIALSEINISKDLSQKLLKCLGENDIKKCQSLIDSDIDLRRHSLTLFRSAKNYQIKRFVSADRISVRPVPRTDQAFDFYLGEKSYTKLVSDQDIPRGHATMKDFLENLANMDDVKEAFNEQNSSRLILTSLGGMLHENRISIRGISDLTVDEALKQHYNRFPFNVHLEVEKAHNITPKASGGSSSSVNSNEAAPPPYDEQDKKSSANVASSSSSSGASNAGAPKGGGSNVRKFVAPKASANVAPKASGGSSSSVNSNEAAPPPYDEQDKKTSANVAPSSSSSSASNAGAPKGGVSNLRKFWEQQNK